MNASFICITLASVAASLSGCAGIHYNEGASRSKTNFAGSGDNDFEANFYALSESENKSEIKTGEAFSVSLISSHICDFRESSLSGFSVGEIFNSTNSKSKICNNGDTSAELKPSRRKTRGEILIVANAAELGESSGISFDAAKLRDNGRVIYYGPDVRESGQLLNMENLPVYGPLLYKGGRFALDLGIVELDNEENEQIKSLLTTLASMGKTVAPTGGPLIDLLNTLGGTLISGNGDDVELRYHTSYDLPASKEVSKVERKPLAEGHIALVREETRSETPEWNKICVDKKSGLLRHRDINKKECDGEVYRDRTWLLLRVAREDKDSNAVKKAIAQETVGVFLDRTKTDLRGNNPSAELQSSLAAVVESLKALECTKAQNEKNDLCNK